VYIRFLISLLVLSAILVSAATAVPFKVIIVTGNDESERGYTEFLQQIYKGNVDVHIDSDKYDEDLSDKKKSALESADLIIVSRDLAGKDYNADADFWNGLKVPILNHNIKLAQSNDHKYWDWLAGDDITTSAFTHLAVAYSQDEIFTGVDTSTGYVEMFPSGKEIDQSDQGSAGNGTLIATCNGGVVIARWLGNETSYYDGSD
jgi:hypothetical protein